MAKAFLAKYFPPAKTAKIIKDITTFQQFEMESLSDAWERFKELLSSCPHYGLPRDVLIRTFYNGVTQSTKDTIDAATRGSLMRKIVEAVFSLLKEMTNNNCLWPSECQNPPRQGGKIGVDSVTALQAQIVALTK